jgi:hypothetical protein
MASALRVSACRAVARGAVTPRQFARAGDLQADGFPWQRHPPIRSAPMASIHVSEIQSLLFDRGERDAKPFQPEGYFFEIRFDQPGERAGVVDSELQNKVITADTPYGLATIQFDDEGQLKSIDTS